MSMYHLDGEPMTSDPRHALARQVAVLADKGLTPAGAFELEFFLLANERDADGRVQPAEAVLDGRKSGKTEVYSVDHLHGMEPLFSDIYASAASARHPCRDGDLRICAGPIRADAQLPQGRAAGPPTTSSC